MPNNRTPEKNTAEILLIEDDGLTVTLLEHLLARQGFQVQIARDGHEAQTHILSRDQPPSLVMLDLMLPYIDGYELLQMMRSDPRWQRTPVIVLSGKSQEEDIVRAFKLGASDFVVKPFRTNEMMARIIRHIEMAEPPV